MLMKSNIDREHMISEAGRLAVEYKHMGYHCSESIVRAVPRALGLPEDPSLVRAACGFFGGGGGTGDRCGIIDVGIMLISALYGRLHPLQDENNIRVLVKCLTDRFTERFSGIYCRDIKPAAVARCGTEMGCEETYAAGASLLAELLLDADQILSTEAK